MPALREFPGRCATLTVMRSRADLSRDLAVGTGVGVFSGAFGVGGGILLVPYLAAAGLSWALAGDHSSYNPFERLAGLADGGYPAPQTRRSRGPRGRD